MADGDRLGAGRWSRTCRWRRRCFPACRLTAGAVDRLVRGLGGQLVGQQQPSRPCPANVSERRARLGQDDLGRASAHIWVSRRPEVMDPAAGRRRPPSGSRAGSGPPRRRVRGRLRPGSPGRRPGPGDGGPADWPTGPADDRSAGRSAETTAAEVRLAGRLLTENDHGQMPQKARGRPRRKTGPRLRPHPVCRFRFGGMDAARGNACPHAGDGSQAGAFRHRGRSLPPAGRKGQFCRPNRMLALVVDDDRKGIVLVCSRGQWTCRAARFVPINHARQFCLCSGRRSPAVSVPRLFGRMGDLSLIGCNCPGYAR